MYTENMQLPQDWEHQYESGLAVVDMLKDAMSEKEVKRFKLKEKRIVAAFFYELGASNEHFSSTPPAGIALFADKRSVVTDDRQYSQSSDGFAHFNGCQNPTCKQPGDKKCSLISMLCSHRMCSRCTTTNGLCQLCAEQCLSVIGNSVKNKAKSRGSRFIDVTHLHLSKLPGEGLVEETVANDQEAQLNEDSDVERVRDSDSDSDDDDDNSPGKDTDALPVLGKKKKIDDTCKKFQDKIAALRKSLHQWRWVLPRPLHFPTPSTNNLFRQI